MRIEMTSRRLVTGLALAGLLGFGLVAPVAAQDDTAAAGNGGTVTSSSNGGAVTVGDANSGDTEGTETTVAVSAEDIIAEVYEALGLEVPE
jgi:hypothetical protein